MSIRHREWTEAEDDLLRREYAHVRTATVCAKMGRTKDAVGSRALRLGIKKMPQSRALPSPVAAPEPTVPAALVVELAEARMEADALRILLAMKCDMLSTMEAGWALGLSSEPPDRGTVYSQTGRLTSPLVMHAMTQAAIGMDLASRRLNRGGVLEGSGGSNQFVRRSGGNP